MTAGGVRVAVFLTLCSAGCATEQLPRPLFAVDMTGAEYPVMLSKGAATDPGRPLAAESGMLETVGGEWHEWGRSEMAASPKLMAQVRRADKWVQIEAIEYNANDHFATFGLSQQRLVRIVGAAR
jgi:hypothetical protein